MRKAVMNLDGTLTVRGRTAHSVSQPVELKVVHG